MLNKTTQESRSGGVSAIAPAAVRVLQVGPLPPPLGGMATYVEGYLNSSVVKAFDVSVVRTDLLGKYRFSGLPRKVFNVLNAAALTGAVTWAIIRRRPAIVHIQTNSFAGLFEKAFLAAIARTLGRRVLMHVHGGLFRQFYEQSGRLTRWLIRRSLAVSHLAIAPTPAIREDLQNAGVRPEKIALLTNPVFLPERSIWHGAPAGERPEAKSLTVLYLGRIDAAKGLPELVAAAERVLGRGLKARFRIVGPPSADGEALRDSIAARGLGGHVTLVGPAHSEAKRDEFLAADVYVLPSHVEALPYSLLEAMSYGLPCLATRVGGVGDVLTDGENGLLVEAREVDALAEGIARLLTDASLRRRLGTAARQTVAERFDWSARAADVIDLYHALLVPRQ